MTKRNSIGFLFPLLLIIQSCGDELGNNPDIAELVDAQEDLPCAPAARFQDGVVSGVANVFLPDPMTSSGDLDLAPSYRFLDEHATQVELERLDGSGVLAGPYTHVRNLLHCNGEFGAFRPEGNFEFSHRESGFQEAMTYYFSDRYNAFLDEIDSLHSSSSLMIYAHCMEDDNAFYYGSPSFEFLCFGNSVATPGVSYSDDAYVIVHEIQHGVTRRAYSSTERLGNLDYDEAGALNEAISDFAALLFLEDTNASTLDPKQFSRWALGSFVPGARYSRGAHRCPEYDSHFPTCERFASSEEGFSVEPFQTLSYVYPDGVGWPYANNFSRPGYLKSVYERFSSFEAIHTTGVVIAGALFELFEAVLRAGTREIPDVKNRLFQLVIEGIRHLPKPSSQNVSPVSFMGFAQTLLEWAPDVGFSSEEVLAMRAVFEQRGLVNTSTLPADWPKTGPGSNLTPGIKIYDHPSILKQWAARRGANPRVIGQSIDVGLNQKVDRGETFVIWFDIESRAEKTAGNVQLDIEVSSDVLEILGNDFNDGAISSRRAQIYYSKVNGSQIVERLSSDNSTFHVPTGNSYFETNPGFAKFPTTGIWMRVRDRVRDPTETEITVRVRAQNDLQDVAPTLSFSVIIN